MPIYRSWLFVPGSSEKKLQKLSSISSDVFILDLEDAVNISVKEKARFYVSEYLKKLSNDTSKYVIRVNAYNTPFFESDIEMTLCSNLYGIMLPKSETPEDILYVDQFISKVEREKRINKNTIKIIPLIETALGIHNAYGIAKSSKRIPLLIFGAIDYLKDIQAELTLSGEELLYPRAHLVNSSRAADIDRPIDTVYPNFKDEKGFLNEAIYAKKMGFQGKLLIHPQQVSVANEAFTPSKKEVKRALKIIKSYEKARANNHGVIQVDGEMIDLPVVDHAKKIVEQYNELTKK